MAAAPGKAAAEPVPLGINGGRDKAGKAAAKGSSGGGSGSGAATKATRQGHPFLDFAFDDKRLAAALGSVGRFRTNH